jgi:hypothetical protein
VPGWFQGALTLYDAAGRELAYADHDRFDPEPVLIFEVPKDGRYTVEIRDALYRGREDFVYRLVLGQVPFITAVFPLGGKAGERTTVELTGCNLPTNTLTLDHRDQPPGLYPFSVGGRGPASNVVPFALDDLPERLEQEPNGTPDTAQQVTLPVIVNGRIAKPDESDLFRFEGRAGQEIVAEVSARRLRSPLDSVLSLTDAAGHPLARNDDHEDKGSGLDTHHSDSYLRATLPATGVYLLHLADVQHKGGPDYAYRLRISPPQPDFALRMAPSHVIARAGASVPVSVIAIRKDGFAGPIDLALKGASEGLALSGGPIPAGQDQVNLTLKVLYWTGKENSPRLNIEGRATVGTRQISRDAVPAENMTQAFEYKHLVPADDLKMTVTGRVAPRVSIKILSATPVKIPIGQIARVQLGVSPPDCLDNATVQLSGKPPQGIALETFAHSAEGMELVLRCDASTAKPGQRGNLALVAAPPEPPPPADAKTPARPVRPQLTRLPSIPFQVVAAP